MDVEIVEVRRIADTLQVFGRVAGEGYRVSLPATDVATGTRAERQRVIGAALKAAYDATHGVPLDLAGTVRL